MKKFMRAACGACALLAATAAIAAPPAQREFEVRAANLLVVLRESPGSNKQDEALAPFGPISARLADGREVKFEASWYQYLGDMHLRLVFDGARSVQSALPGDLRQLHLTPDEALERAVENLRRRYGAPVAEPWSGGLMQVHGDAPELDSSYFLDRAFWLEQLRRERLGVLLTEQNAVFALRHADRGYILEKGRCRAEGSRAELADGSALHTYLGVGGDGRWVDPAKENR